MSIIGENLKKLRASRKLTIEQLSKQSNVGKSTISELETGKAKNPKTDTLLKIADALGVKLEDLTSMEVEKEYIITDIEDAMSLILSQENLMLNGEVLTSDAKIQLANSIKMALEFTKQTQAKTKK